MPRSRDILQRFRPAGTPGAAAAGGVPADRVAEVSAELEPVLARLEAVQDEVSRIRGEAEQEAERRRQRAMARSSAIVATAHREAGAERADAALRVSRQVDEENAATLAEAERAAAAVRRHAAERMPSYLDQVLTVVRDTLHAGEEPQR